jgi:hypothetical protein
MRSKLLAVLVAGLVLLAGCAGTLQSGTAPASDPVRIDSDTDVRQLPLDAQLQQSPGADGPTISVTGVGEVTADPDVAVVHVSVIARADSAEGARADAATRVNDLLAALEAAGVADDDVETTGFSIRQDRDREGEPTDFVAVHSLRVETTPDEAGATVDTVVGAAEASVDSVQFTLSDEVRADLRAEALTRAVDAARADADAVAAAAGVEVAGVHTASTGGASYPAFAAFDERAADGASASTSFRPGPVTVSASVSIAYHAR